MVFADLELVSLCLVDGGDGSRRAGGDPGG